MQSIRFTLPISALDTKLVCVRLRLRLVDIFVKMLLLKAFFLVILPVPVSLKRFLALELVFIFGITVLCIYLFNLLLFVEVKAERRKLKGFNSSPTSNLRSLTSTSSLRSG